ncbi:membrane protein [Streptomyces aureoverticillatus]|nr:membrane protein [Streptomyces aureoverticillatus]
MHMNSAPHLLNEDRPEYERVLDEALRTAPNHPELAAVGQRLNPEQLRTMALNATALITAAAAAEYHHYVKVREELRDPGPSSTSSSIREGSGSSSSSTESGTGGISLATTMGEVTETAGAGLVAVIAVLAPVLAGAAAAIFLLVGYILKMLDPEPAFADTLLTAGWLFGALTAGAILVAAVGLLLTALRNGSTSLQAGSHHERNEEVDRAREAWCQALLERGVLPFLREALADPDATAASAPRASSPGPAGRMPQLGYHRPGFSSPDGGSTTGTRPSYSSPDFSSPDYGGPEHPPE